MLKSKQGLISNRSYSYMASYGEDSPDELAQQQHMLDLEIGIPSGRRPPRNKIKRSAIAKLLHRLQQRHKVAAWLILLCIVVITSSLLLASVAVYQNIIAASAPIYTSSHTYPLHKLHNLVMVAGHSVYTSTGCEKPDNENAWFLESYQKHPGQASTFVQHIRAGVESAASDENALLLFSGGETRKNAGPLSEAQSYWSVAESSNWFGFEEEVRSRALTEEHARDSFENLLFSICRFKELTGNYPRNITVVSYNFKETRFANVHRLALRFPASHFFYRGTPASPSSTEAALRGEANVLSQFQEDPYGCFGPLHSKRLDRDPFARTVPYPNGCPELKELFSYCGTTIFPGSLPWDKHGNF